MLAVADEPPSTDREGERDANVSGILRNAHASPVQANLLSLPTSSRVRQAAGKLPTGTFTLLANGHTYTLGYDNQVHLTGRKPASGPQPAFIPDLRSVLQELAEIIKSNKQPWKDYCVIDVRDDDWRGGNIKGSHNSPSHGFLLKVDELVQRTKEVPIVVFHCALSQVRYVLLVWLVRSDRLCMTIHIEDLRLPEYVPMSFP